MIKKKHRNITSLIVILVLFVICLIFLVNYSYVLQDPRMIKEILSQYGVLAPVVFTILQIIQVLVPFIPGAFMTMGGGYLFGWLGASIYTVIGVMIAATIAFYLSRRFGRPIVEEFINEKEIKHFDILFKKRERTFLFITEIVPIFPNDAVFFVSGLTKIKFKDFFYITLLTTFLKNAVWAYFGYSIYLGDYDYKFTIVGLLLVGLILVYVFRHKIKIFVFKEIRILEQDFKKIQGKKV